MTLAITISAFHAIPTPSATHQRIVFIFKKGTKLPTKQRHTMPNLLLLLLLLHANRYQAKYNQEINEILRNE